MDITLGRVLPAGITGAADFAAQLGQLARTTPSGLTGAEDSALSTQQSGLSTGAGAGNVMESFGQLLSQALQDVNTTHQVADADAARLAAGDDGVDIHQVMIGMEKANISLGLTLQVRNKLVEAYQEIMRMQV